MQPQPNGIYGLFQPILTDLHDSSPCTKITPMNREPIELTKTDLGQTLVVPDEYRFTCPTVYLFHDWLSADLIISKNPAGWTAYHNRIHDAGIVHCGLVPGIVPVSTGMIGPIQIIPIPSQFTFSTNNIYIDQDITTDDIVLSEYRDCWDDLIRLMDNTSVPDNWTLDRDQQPPDDRPIFTIFNE